MMDIKMRSINKYKLTKNIYLVAIGKVTMVSAYLLMVVYSRAQQITDPVKYEIGDQVSNFQYDSVISNVDDGDIRLSDYKGKAIIIDFWATWCKPCVASFPKLEAIQEKYKDELKVLLFSDDKESKIKEFYRLRPEFKLSTAMFDSKDSMILRFPHKFLPHYVWLDRHHKVHSITGMDGLTEENVKELLAGDKTNAYQKDDSEDMMDLKGMVVDSIEIGRMGARMLSIDSNLMAGSQISKYDWRLTKMSRFSKPGDKKGFMEFTNYSIAGLYQMAYLGVRRDRLHKELFFIDCVDSTVTYPNMDDMAKFKKWEKTHTYSYRLILPKAKEDSALMFTYMKRDLDNFFGLTAVYETRELDWIVLKTVDAAALKSSGRRPQLIVERGTAISVINKPFDQLMYALRVCGINYRSRSINPWLPLIDETEISGNIDFVADGLTSDDKLVHALEEKGIMIIEEKRKVRVLVLK
ncbi:TlpA family protein disulfide reductase [Sphingobacterium bambusae]|uniref:TlpA family protein disulfide reductase n=1 Tax=Sphingobacterium bambusae TaxID=662858 RepID=A0ABW6B9Y5_9SPHI|nr:TlpA disulfide reductase family protein [Sphingobacterium bambusae]WPL48475.1 TlpA disulfide reductase family protein [Sphingobacterium bambusae]